MRSTSANILRNIPQSCFLFSSITILVAEISNYRPGDVYLLGTCVFPLAWVAAVYLARTRGGETGKQIGKELVLLFGGIFLILFCLIFIIPDLGPVQWHTIEEILALFWFLTMLVHCAAFEGRWGVAAFFGVGLIYGVVLENGGIAMGFFSEPGFSLRLPGFPAPLWTVSGWCVMIYCGYWFAKRVLPDTRPDGVPPWGRTFVAVAAAVSFDLQMDPFATRLGLWKWNDSLPPFFCGVPLINYIAWVSALTPFFYFYFRFVKGKERKRIGTFLLALPLMLAIDLGVAVGLSLILLGWDSPTLELFRTAPGRVMSMFGLQPVG